MLYSRSDVTSVVVPATGHAHMRPTDKEATAKLRHETGDRQALAYVQPWALSCTACEPFLESEPGWVRSAHGIPKTHDEELALAEDKKGGDDMAQALFRLLRSAAQGAPVVG